MRDRTPSSRPAFLSRAAVLLAVAALGLSCSQPAPKQEEAAGKFQPTWESLRTHEVPAWYNDAKFGIFIHWGLYSVPAWATPTGELGKVDPTKWFANNPYAEWYLNTLRIEGSPTQEHHTKTYGKDFDYLQFANIFNKDVQKWDPEQWASLFSEVGAKYVVLTTKHHDGWTLWPSEVKNPNRPADLQGASRDIVGDLSEAVRGKGMRMGLYYSGGLDWSFTKEPIRTMQDVRGTVIHTEEYAKYADAQWRELIKRYQPAILWNDIGYPRQGDLVHIFADYYNEFPEGLINNRFRQSPTEDQPHYDFTTPEYAKMDKITPKKWETCRGLGFSFGYNQVEGEKQVIQPNDLVELLVDIVSKNGNLLLNVGPKPDGTIPPIQVDRLRKLGSWLAVNGEAIYETTPYDRAAGKTGDNGEVRFTRHGTATYAVLFDKPKGKTVVIKDFQAPAGADVSLLGAEGGLQWSQEGNDLKVNLPTRLPGEYAWTVKVATKM